VHEMRVQDRRTSAPEVAGDAEERDRVDIGGEGDRVERDAARPQLACEVPGARLGLVEHEKAHVPTSFLQLWQQREQVRLRARDAGNLLQMENVHVAAAMMPSAHVSTE